MKNILIYNQKLRIKRLLPLHQSPGNDQHLSCQFHPHFGLNSLLLLPSLEFLGEIHHEVLIAYGCYQRSLKQGIAKRCFPFLGNHGDRPIRTQPASLSDKEAEKLITQITEGAYTPKPKVSFGEGENVRVIDGPFTNFVGTVQEVRPDKRKAKVLISIFGRSTPIELDFIQIERN